MRVGGRCLRSVGLLGKTSNDCMPEIEPLTFSKVALRGAVGVSATLMLCLWVSVSDMP